MRGLRLALSLESGGQKQFVKPPVAGYVIALDFSIGVTLSGANISSIKDQSGNGNDFTAQANPLPFSASGLAGTPCANSSGSSGNAYLQCVNNQNTILTGAAAHKFVVMWADSSQIAGMFSQNDGSSSATYLPYIDGHFYDSWYTSARKTLPVLDAHTAPVVYDAVSSGTEWTANINGSQVFTTASNAVAATAAKMTIMGGPNGQYWQGKLAYVLVYPSKITGANYTSLISFLRTRGSGF